MSLSGNDWAQIKYNSIDKSRLSEAEKTTLLNKLREKYNQDVSYLTGNATILPTGIPTPMSNSAGAVVGTGLLS